MRNSPDILLDRFSKLSLLSKIVCWTDVLRFQDSNTSRFSDRTSFTNIRRFLFQRGLVPQRQETSVANDTSGLVPQRQETSVANDTSGLVPQRQKALDYDNSDPVPQLQHVSPSVDTTAPSQQELDLLLRPLYDEFFNAGTLSVNKPSSPTDNSK
ncbi:hypothetical protein Tco_0023429 [Tanacetum coccineum]